MADRVLVTGGAGYIGALACRELLAAGHPVRTLDALLHGQREVADALRTEGVEVIEGDVRDPHARTKALDRADHVVHLAAIVGDPACAAEPQRAADTNVAASEALIAEARTAGVRRFVFASTCSNYGRLADPETPVAEDAPLRPVSLYAEQKVAIERRLLEGHDGELLSTCLRFATIHGVAPRMRFDLTVNEFTRDLWAGRELEVFGGSFWRPYLHVADAGRAIRAVLDADETTVAGEVFNVGRTDQNLRKRELAELIARMVPTGSVRYVHRDEDPRDYRVAFDKVRDRLKLQIDRTVPDGIAEVVSALDGGRFADPFDGRYRNTP